MQRIAKWAAVGLVVTVSLLLVVAAIIHAAWNHERVGRSISAWASKTLSGTGPTEQALVIRSVDYPLWGALRSVLGGQPVRVDVWDFVIRDIDGKEVLRASHVNVGVQLGHLVRAQLVGHLPFTRPDLELHLVDAIVDDVHVHLALDSEQKVNLVHAFKRREDAKPRDPRSGMVIEVTGSSVRDGSFEAAFPKWRATFDHLSVIEKSLRYSSFREEQREHSPAFTYLADHIEAVTGNVQVDGLHFPLDHVLFTELSALEPDRTNVHFAGGTGCLGATIRGNGMLTDTYSKGKTGVDLTVSARHGAKIVAELPLKKYLSGDPSGGVHVTGPFHALKLEGEVHDLEGHIAGLTATKGSGRFRLAKGMLDLTRLRAELAGGHVEGNATLHLAQKLFRIELWPKDFKAAALGRYLPLEWATNFVGFFARRNENGELEDHFKVAGIDVGLFRSTRVSPPEHVVIRNDR
ncbi:MAG: hypothetical protein ABI321_06910 [Polyangia bacterium]